MAELVQNQLLFPVIILPVTFASKNVSSISREFTLFFPVPDVFAIVLVGPIIK